MATKRPHVSLNAVQLEAMLDANPNDPLVLREILSELAYRTTPSAKALRKKAETAYAGLGERPLSGKTGAQLQELFESADGDQDELRDLHHELRFRKTQSARLLLRKVEEALNEAPPTFPAYQTVHCQRCQNTMRVSINAVRMAHKCPTCTARFDTNMKGSAVAVKWL